MQTLIGALVAPSHGYDNLRFDQLRVIMFHAGKSSESFETFKLESPVRKSYVELQVSFSYVLTSSSNGKKKNFLRA